MILLFSGQRAYFTLKSTLKNLAFTSTEISSGRKYTTVTHSNKLDTTLSKI